MSNAGPTLLNWADSMFTIIALFGLHTSVWPLPRGDIPMNTRRILVLCALDSHVLFSAKLNGTTNIIHEWHYCNIVFANAHCDFQAALTNC